MLPWPMNLCFWEALKACMGHVVVVGLVVVDHGAEDEQQTQRQVGRQHPARQTRQSGGVNLGSHFRGTNFLRKGQGGARWKAEVMYFQMLQSPTSDSKADGRTNWPKYAQVGAAQAQGSCCG